MSTHFELTFAELTCNLSDIFLHSLIQYGDL